MMSFFNIIALLFSTCLTMLGQLLYFIIKRSFRVTLYQKCTTSDSSFPNLYLLKASLRWPKYIMIIRRRNFDNYPLLICDAIR